MRASMSSRENPSAVCVRSLVPNEKKSACWAIASAMKHARGSSIIVPIETVARAPSGPAPPLRLEHALDEPADQLELALVGDQRDHDLDLRAGDRAQRPRDR